MPVRLPVRPRNITSDIIFDYKIIKLSYTVVNASDLTTSYKISGLVPVYTYKIYIYLSLIHI